MNSWSELHKRFFFAYFTVSRRKPKYVESLRSTRENNDGILKLYIYRFNKEALFVKKILMTR